MKLVGSPVSPSVTLVQLRNSAQRGSAVPPILSAAQPARTARLQIVAATAIVFFLVYIFDSTLIFIDFYFSIYAEICHVL